ncbi:MAG: hypothetical protein KGQ69_09325 [Rhodospirillales bacterium]|nr:hypothetical protein [Rhodospirillales bacterium]
MNVTTFRASITDAEPPSNLSLALRALWLDAKGDWEAAHSSAQADRGGVADWVHAYLHRKEGDESNAAYWYRRARKPFFNGSLEAEWEEIAVALLAQCKSSPKPILD